MTPSPLLPALLRAVRRRLIGIAVLWTLPWCAAGFLWVQRVGTTANAAATSVTAALLGALWLGLRWQHHDLRWLISRLNAQRSDMDDSADLLLGTCEQTPLQRLQHARLQSRLRATPADLRPAWPRLPLALSFALAATAALLAVTWPAHFSPQQPAPHLQDTVQTKQGPATLLQATLQIQPPSYTGLPQRTDTTLSVKAPQTSQLHWRLQFSAQPQRVSLRFLDGKQLPLTLKEGDWEASLSLQTSTLYRIEVDGKPLANGKRWRLDAVLDQPPHITIMRPDRSLTLAPPSQTTWQLQFEARDDYAVAAQATLRLTLAQGSGENIQFSERSIPLTGTGTAKKRNFSYTVNLHTLGLASGDDLFAQLIVQDNRSPQPHTSRSSSLILRLQTAQEAESGGMEGAVKRVLPAYFRSQRQIIIDAEALQKQKPKLAADAFLQRSDSIGVDQRILRLRYGQFLGEEASDADHATGAHEHDDHDSPAGAQQVFGENSNLLEAFGHTHDSAEAATLLDPETRATLKKALDQMWQSELHLRQGHPDRALPFAYKALGFIKQVQQASRIYLARVGPELPPIDESRRLTGKREGLSNRSDMLQLANAPSPLLVTLWRELGEMPTTALPTTALPALSQQLQSGKLTPEDPLLLQEAIDTLQQQPDCQPCRNALRAQLWPLLPTPPAAVPRRTAADTQGNRYLDALRREITP